jgi:hypothetical protein
MSNHGLPVSAPTDPQPFFVLGLSLLATAVALYDLFLLALRAH